MPIEINQMSYNEKQIQIIELAEELFASRGFDGTSVRDISQAAGVNLAMVSYYFGSKEKLLEAIFEYRIQSTSLQLESLINDTRIAPLQKIYTFIDHYTDRLFRNQSFYKLMLREQLRQLENTELREIIYKSKLKNFDLISRLIGQGQKMGLFKKKIDISLMVSTLTGSSNQIFFNQSFYRRANKMTAMPEEEFQKLLKKKIRLHLKSMFKAILTNDTEHDK